MFCLPAIMFANRPPRHLNFAFSRPLSSPGSPQAKIFEIFIFQIAPTSAIEDLRRQRINLASLRRGPIALLHRFFHSPLTCDPEVSGRTEVMSLRP
jgi:hypothetical protein